MPTFRSIEVLVTDKHDTPLQEYGISTDEDTKTTTCYIQSTIGKQFRIVIRPSKLPWPEFEHEKGTYDHGESSRERTLGVGGRSAAYGSGIVSSRASGRQSERAVGLGYGATAGMVSGEEYDAWQAKTRWQPENAPVKMSLRGKAPPKPVPTVEVPETRGIPYHLLACLRLHGSGTYIDRKVIHLDERRAKKVVMASDTLPRDTTRGAESHGGARGVPYGGEDVLAPQIELVLWRISIPEDDQIDLLKLSTAPHHATEADYTTSRQLGAAEREYEPYVSGEPPFATFVFQYREEGVLRGMRLIDDGRTIFDSEGRALAVVDV